MAWKGDSLNLRLIVGRKVENLYNTQKSTNCRLGSLRFDILAAMSPLPIPRYKGRVQEKARGAAEIAVIARRVRLA